MQVICFCANTQVICFCANTEDLDRDNGGRPLFFFHGEALV
jgi:hypothetical protein